MVDINYCMSSFLSLRYIEDDNIFFKEGIKYNYILPANGYKPIEVFKADDVEKELSRVIKPFENEKVGLLLSGGMDSAVVAAFMKSKDAYTFRYENGFKSDEIERAKKFADYYGLNLHYVDISWGDFLDHTPILMRAKGAPVHSIEPQIYKAALQAKSDGISRLLFGHTADIVFGGMDLLLSKDWTIEEFAERYSFVKPEKILKAPLSMMHVFERYRRGDKIDTLSFLNDVYSKESFSSYSNAFNTAGILYFDPFAHMRFHNSLDIKRLRNGESKYIIRELFKKKYPYFTIPEKVPMPRQVNEYLFDWKVPKNNKFLENIDMSTLNGDQKWMIYSLQSFLNLIE